MPTWFSDGWKDLTFATRIFTKRPAFTLITIFTLALGTGAAVSVYSIVYSVLLRPLPMRDPDRLVVIWEAETKEPNRQMLDTYADFEEYRRSARLITDVSAVARSRPILTYAGVTRQLIAGPVYAGWLETVGGEMELGRAFTEEEERTGCAVVLHHSFWTSVLAADPAIIGKSLILDQRPCTVVGVLNPRFSAFPIGANLWTSATPALDRQSDQGSVAIFARLRPGVTLDQARQEVAALHTSLHQQDGKESDKLPNLDTIHNEWLALFGGKVRTTILLVFAAVGALLLIGCLNVANLLTTRLLDRNREFVVRAALGSGQGRLVRQLLTEASLLSAMGTGCGVALATVAVRYFRSIRPIELPQGTDVALNLPVLLFALLAGLATMVVIGLIPALRGSRVDLSQRLRSASRSLSGKGIHRRASQAMVTVEVAMSMLLLFGAGLFMTSALRMQSEPLGFDQRGVYATPRSLPRLRYPSPERQIQYYRAVVERLEQLPGVSGAAIGSTVPPDREGGWRIETKLAAGSDDNKPADVAGDAVGPGYFETLRVPLMSGRDFNLNDTQVSEPVAVMNDAAARKYFPNQNPIGQRIRLVDDEERSPWMTVVGIVGTVKRNAALINEVAWTEGPAVYRPLTQETRSLFQVVVRASSESPTLARQIQEQIVATDPLIPLAETETLNKRLAGLMAYPRFRAIALALFAWSALVLAGVGLYGVLSHAVTRRTQEFGIRRALGAQTLDLLRLVAVEGGLPIIVGMTLGLGCALAFGRVLESLLYGVKPADLGVLTLVSITMLSIGATAIAVPAFRAARVNPLVALRDE